MKRVFFPGSFNPFSRGHADIVERSLKLFDEVVVGVGYNINKGRPIDIEERVEAIAARYASCPQVKAIAFSGLAAQTARELGAVAIVRGVRTYMDFEYEKNMANLNRQIAGIDTIFLPARPELECVSSSAIRELRQFGVDVSELI